MIAGFGPVLLRFSNCGHRGIPRRRAMATQWVMNGGPFASSKLYSEN